MADKPTFEELEQRVKELEKEALGRRKTEGDLKIFKTAVESSINAIGITDLEGRVIYVNDSSVKMWGYNSKDEILGRFLSEFWEGDGYLKSVEALREKGAASGEEVGKRKDGSLFIVQFTASMFKDEAGNPSFMFGSFFDITERKQVEGALRESEEKCRHLSEGTSEAVVWHDKGKIIEANEQYYEMFGYKPEELAEKDAILLTATPDSVKFMREQISLGNQGPYEVVGMKKDGTEFPMEIRVKIMRYKGKIARMAAIRDLTVRKQAEKALLESEKRYRALAENSLVGIWHITFEGYTIYVNPAMCSMLEIEGPEELTGKTYHSFFTPESLNIIKRERGKRLKGIGSSYEVEIIGKHGRKRIMTLSGAPLFSADDKAQSMIATFTDITDRKRAEEKLREAHDKLEHRVKERTKDLEIKTKRLEEVNTALRVLIDKRGEDKINLEENVLSNINKLVLPYLHKIKQVVSDDIQKTYLEFMESNINEIISSFANKLSSKYINLTPAEIQVADFVKHGKRTKEIANLLNLSVKTVESHRDSIRKKLDLTNKKTNLRSYLLSLH